jgi:hypothetical protein
MSPHSDEVLAEVFDALRANAPTTELEDEIVRHFGEYAKDDRFGAVSLPFLLKLVSKGKLQISPDDVCRLFIDVVPYNGYSGLALLGGVNFRRVSTPTLLQMREISAGDGAMMVLPIVDELIASRAALDRAMLCDGPRRHEFDDPGVCRLCRAGVCLGKTPDGFAQVHRFGDEGRCLVCGAPRCNVDGLHVFNIDGHCHLCGKAQPTRCDIVGCQPGPEPDFCAICDRILV